jgi:hypothetical protein
VVMTGATPRDTDAIPLFAAIDPATMRPVAVRAHNVSSGLGDLSTASSGIGGKGVKTFGALPFGAGVTTLAVPANANRISLLLTNVGGGTIYMGNTSGYNDTNGWPLATGGFLVDTTSRDAWYVYSTLPGAEVRWIEVVPT